MPKTVRAHTGNFPCTFALVIEFAAINVATWFAGGVIGRPLTSCGNEPVWSTIIRIIVSNNYSL